MKSELDIKKNKLDLKHQALLQKLNAIYIGLFIGIISFVATWIFQPSNQKIGIVITIMFIILLIMVLNKTKKEIKNNLNEIDNLLK